MITETIDETVLVEAIGIIEPEIVYLDDESNMSQNTITTYGHGDCCE